MRASGLFVAAALASLALPAVAGSLSCRSVNGNVVCAGPGATSCQTVDGRTVCTSGDGDVVQSFGAPPADLPDEAAPDPDEATSATPSSPRRVLVQRHGIGRKLVVDTGRVWIELD